MSDPMIYEDLLRSISLQGLAFGHMPCAVWAGKTAEKSGQVPAHASLSARQAKEKDLLTSGTYGPPCIGWSGSVALSLSLASNLQVLTQMTGSTLYRLTWKPWVMPSGRVRFRLRASVPRTSGTELIGWPTPTANAWKHPSNAGRQGGLNLQTAAQLSGWTTPSASDSRRGGRGITAGMSGSSLAQQVKMAGWPTPTASDHKGGYPGGRIRNGKISTDRLDVVAQIAGPVRLTASGKMLTGSNAQMENGGQLNPALSLWLMGLPPEWDEFEPTETP
ncbi:hypothetical protein SK34_02985 [Citrobacter sp. MGH104]|nr:hypothetical protein SK34_02985 [Citrobacter sp. MGH104]